MAIEIDTSVQPSELVDPSTHQWLLLDVRTPAEFSGAHIAGSVNVPLHALRRQAAAIREMSADDRCIALVCRTDRRAEEARRILEAEHIENPRVLRGGIVAWEQDGLPLVHGRGAISLERQVRIAAGALVLLGVTLGLLSHPGFFGLSAFVGAGLVFAGVTDTCGMAMLLARMPWNRAPAVCNAHPSARV